MRLLPLFSFSLICVPALAVLDSADKRAIDVWPGGGFFAQVVDSTEWRTSFYVTNMDTTTAYAGLIFFDDHGNDIQIPLDGRLTSGIAFTLEPDRTIALETDGVGSLKQGFAWLISCDRKCSDPASMPKLDGKVGAAAVFRQRTPGHSDSEAVVPLEQPESHTHVVFDGRSGFMTGIALLNLADSPVAVTVRDNLGAVIATENLSVPKFEKTVFVIGTRYPATTGRYGTIEFRGTSVIAVGIRFSPNGSFTSSHAMSVH